VAVVGVGFADVGGAGGGLVASTFVSGIVFVGATNSGDVAFVSDVFSTGGSAGLRQPWMSSAIKATTLRLSAENTAILSRARALFFCSNNRELCGWNGFGLFIFVQARLRPFIEVIFGLFGPWFSLKKPRTEKFILFNTVHVPHLNRRRFTAYIGAARSSTPTN